MMSKGSFKRPSGRATPNELPLLLSRTREGVSKVARRCLAGTGLSHQQWRLIEALATGRRLTVQELAQGAELGMPSTSRILRELQRRGIIAVSLAGDRRSRAVGLTADGLKLFGSREPIITELDNVIAQLMGDDKLHDLLSLLTELEQRLGSHRFRTQQGGKHA